VKTINVLFVAALLAITMAAAMPGGNTNESGIGDWYGRLYIDGTLASDGTLVCAYVNGVENARTTIGGASTSGMYLLHVYGNTGDNVTFNIFCDSDYPAKEGKQNWAVSLPSHALNLTIDHAATVGNASDIVSNGTGTLTVTINGAAIETDTYYGDVEQVNISSANGTELSFDFDFGKASLNLSQVNITKGVNSEGKAYMAISGVNFTGGQSGTKTIKLYNVSDSFNGLCVKDAENVTYVQVSSDCSSADETKLKCDGNAVNGKTCTKSGTTLTVSGLTHSAVMQYTVPTITNTVYTSTGSGGSTSSPKPTATPTVAATVTPAASTAPTPAVSTTPIQGTTATPTVQAVTATPTPTAASTPVAPIIGTTGGFDWMIIAAIIAAIIIVGVAAYFFFIKK